MFGNLLDVNVWLALTFDQHDHHRVAKSKQAELAGTGLVFCRQTQTGLLRLLTSEHIMGIDVLTMAAAWAHYHGLIASPHVRFEAEPAGLEAAWQIRSSLETASPKLWNDAYLAAFATNAGLRIVTFDRAFRQFRDNDVLILDTK